jgi:hypothetical protein
MRYQVVVLSEEIGSEMEVTELGWQVHPAAAPSAEFADLRIYMGLCAEDDLGSVFDDNYIEGTRTLVYQNPSKALSGSSGDWATVELDAPYSYDPSQGNLIIEVTWESCVDHQSFYVYSWDTGAIRAVASTQQGAPSSPSGSLSSAMARLILSGTSGGAFTSATFGLVKSSFAGK